MQRYYRDPERDVIIVVDDESGQSKVLPRLRNVRVFVEAGDAKVEGKVGEDTDEQTVRRTKTGGGSKRLCGKCGQRGHNRATCPN